MYGKLGGILFILLNSYEIKLSSAKKRRLPLINEISVTLHGIYKA